ncbi:hypothetical protein [Streptomyces sp. NPDC102415]|uniref:hypothetical protein n=1 Tax=unclassified Streptomyces TaxID=2593676 RepID=UPI003818CB53
MAETPTPAEQRPKYGERHPGRALLAGILCSLQQVLQLCLGVADRARQRLVVAGGQGSGFQSGRGDRCVKLVCRAVVQGGGGERVVQRFPCGVGVESGDAYEAVEDACGMASGAVEFQG